MVNHHGQIDINGGYIYIIYTIIYFQKPTIWWIVYFLAIYNEYTIWYTKAIYSEFIIVYHGLILRNQPFEFFNQGHDPPRRTQVSPGLFIWRWHLRQSFLAPVRTGGLTHKHNE